MLRQSEQQQQIATRKQEEKKKRVTKPADEDEEMKDEAHFEKESEKIISTKRDSSMIQAMKKGDSNRSSAAIKSQNQQLSKERASKNQEPIDLSKSIMKEDLLNNKHRIQFQGYKNQSASNQMCQICFQVLLNPYQDLDVEEDTVQTEQEKDATHFYEIIFCQDCSIPVHWNCLGEGFQLLEFEKQGSIYYLYKCPKCALKPKEKPGSIKCLMCECSDGFMSYCEDQEINVHDHSHQADKKYLYFHRFCAMAFRDYFELVEPRKMEFRFAISKEDLKRDVQSQQLKKKHCYFCNSNQGIMVDCSLEECEKWAHPYCIMKKLKDYYFDAAFEEDIDCEAIHKNRWMYQIYYSQNKELQIQALCPENSQNEIYYCFCAKTPADAEMVMCEYCFIWYHGQCLSGYSAYDYQGKKYKCDKCKQWEKLVQDPLLDIILKRKSYNELIRNDFKSWSFESLLFKEKEQLCVESKIFEQIIFIKAWFYLADYLLQNLTSYEVIQNHIDLANKLYISCDSKKQELEKKISNGNLIIKRHVYSLKETTELKLKDQLDEKSNFSIENERYNLELINKVIKTKEKCKQEAKLINNEIDELENLSKKQNLLDKISRMLTDKKTKPKARRVQSLLEEIEIADIEKFQTFKLFEELYIEFSQWDEEFQSKLKGCSPNLDKLKAKFIDLKNEHTGLKLQNKRYQILQDIFDIKLNTSEAIHLIETGKKLRVDVSDQIDVLKNFTANLEAMEKDIKMLEKSNKKPVQNAFQALVTLASYPLKTKNIEATLKKWHECALWHSKACSFIQDKLIDNLAINDSENSSQTQNENLSDYYWNIEKAQALLNETEIKNLYFDQLLFNQVKEKLAIIEKLKQACVDLNQQKHESKILREYLQELRAIENVDFSEEIKKTENKLKIMQEVSQTVENSDKQKIGIEYLEELEK